ncbi:MAG: sigma 54-interacting transcriptional regulator [Desulfomonilaceae bacterium]|nr:sigma 54-interacting transcriptional regulator [Desulfomonilaceae bacterium]
MMDAGAFGGYREETVEESVRDLRADSEAPFEPAGSRVVAEVKAAVTARRYSTEEALQENEVRYRKLLNAIPDGVVVYDPQGGVTYVNDSFVTLFGWSEEELRGRSIDFVPPDENHGTHEAWVKASEGEASLLETKRLTKDGRLLDIQLRTAVLRDRDGMITESIVFHRDITRRRKSHKALKRAHDELEKRVAKRTKELAEMNEQLMREIADRRDVENRLKEGEERFRAVFETAQDCIFLKDGNFVYTHVNPAFLKALELPEAQVIGKTDNDLFPANEANYIKDLENRVMEGQVMGSSYNLSTRHRAKTFHCIRVPLRNESGETTGICGIARDVTEQKALERRCPHSVTKYGSVVMEATLEHLRLAAAGDSIVLLVGESGSGKDYLAQFLHDHSRRSGGPYFAINCAALAASVAESELFGHEAGSFTGSRGRKRGLLEMAEGGTLLLNEIGELSQELQAKLLTFLDTHSFTRVGGERTVKVNTRIVAATNRNLESEMAAGRFREDLYYRLNVMSVRVPPLRERKEDIPFLTRDLVETLSRKLGRAVPPAVDDSALEILSRYDWPGNVRELRNILERSLILGRSDVITADHISIPRSKTKAEVNEKEIPVSVNVSDHRSMNEALESAKRLMIASALRRCKGNVSAAARMLGISRDALRYHKKALDMD